MYLFKIAKILLYLKSSSNYNKVEKGYFNNARELEGYFVNLSKYSNIKLFLILSTSSAFTQNNSVKELDNVIFITYSVKDFKSIEDFVNNLEKYSKDLINLVEKALKEFSSKEDSDKTVKYNMPYGYSKIKNEVVIDEDEAKLAQKVFQTYIKFESIRKTAELLGGSGLLDRKGERLSPAVISGILHDSRYLEMEKVVIQKPLFLKSQEILRRNSGKETNKNKLTNRV